MGEECESWMGFCQRRTSHAKPGVYVMLRYCCWFGTRGGGGGGGVRFYVGEGETSLTNLLVCTVSLIMCVTRYRWSTCACAG